MTLSLKKVAVFIIMDVLW